MKRLVLITLFAASLASAVTWSRIFNTEEWDDFRCVQEVDDGYIITGMTKTFGPGDYALWLLKVDTLGNTIWSKDYAGKSDTTGWGNFVQPTTDGGYIIAGKMHTGINQIWLLKTNENGDTLWTKNYGNSIAYCIQQTSDGGYIVTGRRNWNDPRLFLLKTDSEGDSLWMRTYLLADWTYSMGYFVQQVYDGGFVCAGLISDTTFENVRAACWILRTDSLGDTLWTYTQGGDNWGDADDARCVRQTDDSLYIALANFGLIRINLEGDSLWTQSYADGSCVQQTEDVGYVLSGNAVKLTSLVTNSNQDPDNVWLLKTNDLGDTEWIRTYWEGITYYVAKTRDKGFIIAGRNIDDPFLIKTDSLGLLGIDEEPVIEVNRGWEVSSHIGKRIAVFYDDLPLGFHARVYNVAGQQVAEIHASGSSGFVTWGIGQPPGVYFISAPNKHNQTITAKVVILH